MSAADQLFTRAQVAQLLAEHAPRDVLKTQEAADYLKLSVKQLDLLRVKGGGPRYAKLGRLVRYRRASLDEWLVENERKHTSEGS